MAHYVDTVKKEFPSMPAEDTYHHGDLRSALLEAVGGIIDESGVGAVSLREAARRAGVSHSAPAHHFGDKLGLLTAFAARGFEVFGDRLAAAYDQAAAEGPEAQFRAIGFAYLRFAMEHRAYFDVMFRAEMHDQNDAEFHQLSHRAFGVLMSAVDGMDPADLGNSVPMHVAMKAWATVHGLATLWLDGALTQFTDEDLDSLALGVFEVDSPA